MPSQRVVVESSQPRPSAYEMLADLSSIACWDHAVRHAHWLDPGPPARGSRVQMRTSFIGRVLDLELEVMELLPTWGIIARADTPQFVRVDSFTLDANVGGGCSVAYERSIRLWDGWRAFDPIVAVALRRNGRYLKAGLEALLNP